MSRRTVLIIVVSAALVIAGAVYLVPKLFSGPTGPGIPNAVTKVEVKGGPSNVSYRIKKLADPPASTILDARPLGQAVEITPSGDSGTTTELHFHLNRAVLPKDEPTCETPTTDINLGIAVFNEQLQVWIPLPTTCTGDELVAIAPHFSTFWSFIVDPGKHVFTTVIGGVQQGVEVVTTTVTSIAQYTIDAMQAVVLTFFRNLTGRFDDAKYVCAPASETYEVAVTTASAGQHDLAGCMVGGRAEELHFRNGLALPLGFDMSAGAEKFLTGPPTSGDIDLLGMIESAAAAVRGKALVFGLEAGIFPLVTQTPGQIRLDAGVDAPSIGLDLALAVLTVVVPAARAGSVELRAVMVEVNKRLVVVATKSGYTAISTTTIKTTVEQVVKENKNWANYAGYLLAAFGVVDCLNSRPLKDPASLADAALTCLGSYFELSHSELKALLLAVAAQIKIVPELIQADAVARLKLAGIDVTKITAAITPKCPSNTVLHTIFEAAINASADYADLRGRQSKVNAVLCEEGWLYFNYSFFDPECNGYCDGVGISFFHWVDGRWKFVVLGSTTRFVMPYDNGICAPLPPKIKSMTCESA